MNGVEKCLDCKMSGCQNVLICMQWHNCNVWVAQCLGGNISCFQNALVSKSGVLKCLGVEISGAEMLENRAVQQWDNN